MSTLVLALANKEGGAHVDSKFDADYTQITRERSLGVAATSGLASQAVGPPHEASVAQIGYEMLKTLDRWFPEVVAPHGIISSLPNPTAAEQSG
jgi:hypothetical protein